MTGWRRAAAVLFAAAVAWVGRGFPLHAQSVRIAVSALSADSTSPAPIITVTAAENQPQLGPYSISLELSLEPQFRTPFYVRTSANELASFQVDSLLPERTLVYFRVRLSDRFGRVVAEAREQHPVRAWLRLVEPARSTLTVLTSRTPRFVWSSPPITVPPGLWIYDVSVINTATGRVDVSAPNVQDTSIVFPNPLQSSTSYRWQVRARAQNGPPSDQVTVTSDASFVIASPDEPTVTLFYQNFPNPFGRGARSALTCFWFDLARPGAVSLIIYDLRLRAVRTIIPGPLGSGVFAVGAYGRQNVSAQTGCDDRVAWDGRDDTGRAVPAGVYLAVFRADGVRSSAKILYRGP